MSSATASEQPVTHYCFKCRAEREMKDIEDVTMKNGKEAIRGVCVVCAGTMYKIGHHLHRKSA